MIKANELRIGNWVTKTDKNYTVAINMLHDIATSENFPIERIPITAKILESAGFEKETTEGKGDYAECWDLRIGYNDWDQDFFLRITDPDAEIDMCLIFSRDVPESNCQIIQKPQFVHQLQNLYFALTGNELEITL